MNRTQGSTRGRPERTAEGRVVRQFLVRLDEELYEKLRQRAFDDRRSKADIVRASLTRYL